MADTPTYDSYQSKTGLTYLWGRLKTIFYNKTQTDELLDGKVDKVNGKGLSTNDYDDNAVSKLSGIATGAEVNTIDSVSVNNTPVAADTNKNVNISVPTQVSDLANDSGFQTATQVATAIDNALSGITGIEFNFDYNRVEDLPSPGKTGVIYFIPNSGSGTNTYDEYVWSTAKNGYELFGTATIDTSALWSKSELTAITTAEIDDILAT